MIHNPTHVFVLGAGASMAYGFPSGIELTRLIIEGTRSGNNLKKFLKDQKWSEDAILNFGQEFNKSNQLSIDRFLTNRNEFLEIGKASIAYLISEKENPENLSKREPENWYSTVFNNLIDEFSIDKILSDPNIFSHIAFLTFNYDRSLEQFLFQSFQSNFGLKEGETISILNKFTIKHIHGFLGKLPWQFSHMHANNGFKYTEGAPPYKISSMGSYIKLAEDRQSDAEIASILKNAKKVHFLGFSYDHLNMKILGIDWKSQNGITHFGTSFELSKLDVDKIERETHNNLKLYPVKIHDYFKNHQSLW